jgi:hypothetical protein
VIKDQAAGDWLRAHGDDMIPVKLIDLLGAVARMEQVHRETSSASLDSVHERIFTCDLPRLRRYLPDQALEELW